MSWLLDSDVLSQPAKKTGDVRVINWIEKHQQQCYTSSIVIAQLAFWVRTKRGKQRAALQMTYLIAKGQPKRIDQAAPACAAALGLF